VEPATWIDLLDPDLAQLEAALPAEVHDTVLDRMGLDPRHDDEPRPRLETHGEYLFGIFVIPVFDHDDDCVVFQEIDVVVTRDRLVSVRKTPPSGEPLDLAPIRGGALANEGGSGMFLYALVDEVAERFLTLVDDIDDEVDELEDMVEEWTGPQVRERVSDLRHAILQVRRMLTPTRDLARSVLDDRTERSRSSSPTPTTSCSAPPTGSTSHATCWRGCATTTRPRSPTTRTR
jgi:magnesium transporter